MFPPKKVQKITFQNLQIYRKSFFFLRSFFVWNTQKDERHQKKQNRKRRNTEKHKYKKFEGQLNNRRRVFSWERMEQNQEDIKEVFFFFNESILSNETLSNDERHRQEMKKIWKSWRNGYFSKHEMFTWRWDVDQHFLLEKQFLWWIFCEVQKIQNFCGKKGISHPKKTKNDERLLFETSYNQKFRKWVLGEMKQVVFLPKEKSIYLVRKSTIEKKGAKQQRR